MKYLILASAIILLFSIACSTSTEPGTKELLSTLWKVESLKIGEETIIPPEGKLYTAKFLVDSAVSGKCDCNNFGANYFIAHGDSLRIDQIQITEIGCGGDQSFSSEYIVNIRAAQSYSIDKNKLYIYTNNNSIIKYIGE